MKHFHMITMLLIVFSINVSGQEGWTKQTSPSNLNLSGVYALDSLNVWAVGGEGIIIHTTDGGVTWDSIPNGTTSSLYTVEFINPDTGWIAGKDDAQYGNIQRTTDGGLNWEIQSLPDGSQMSIMDVDFVEGPPGEPMRGYCTGGLSYTWLTDDYGETWEKLRGDCNEGNFNSCFFTDSITGWFVGTSSMVNPYTIMHTADGGQTFEKQTSPATDIKLNGVCFGTDLKGIAVGINTIIYTSDGGANWEESPDAGYINWLSVFLTETGKAWVVGNNGSIAYSIDWGHTWETQESDVTDPLWEVYFINDNEGWVVGGFGETNTILHTKNGGVISTGINDLNDNNFKTCNLEQNYPNPFDSFTQK